MAAHKSATVDRTYVGNDCTLYQVFIKGLTWLEAYEVHLETGDPLDCYLQADGTFLLDGVVKELQ